METMSVIAPKGKIFPKMLSTEMITDKEAVTVPAVSYYTRAVDEGSLMRETADDAAPVVPGEVAGASAPEKATSKKRGN